MRRTSCATSSGQDQGPRQPGGAQVHAPADRTPPDIVLLDDDAAGGALLAECLGLMGHAVRCHVDARSALMDLRESPARVLITDLHLGRGAGGHDFYGGREGGSQARPDVDPAVLVDGLRLAELCLSRAYAGYVVLMTGDERALSRARNAGVDVHVFDKPVDLDRLHGCLRRWQAAPTDRQGMADRAGPSA